MNISIGEKNDLLNQNIDKSEKSIKQKNRLQTTQTGILISVQRIAIFTAFMAYVLFVHINSYNDSHDETQVLQYQYFILIMSSVCLILFGVSSYSAGMNQSFSFKKTKTHNIIQKEGFLHGSLVFAFAVTVISYAFFEDTIHNRALTYNVDHTTSNVVIDFENVSIAMEVISTISTFLVILLTIIYVVNIFKLNKKLY
jgi:hypothetical protein